MLLHIARAVPAASPRTAASALLIMALAAAVLLGSCQASPSPAAPAGSMLATAADNGGVVKLASGQLLLVELLANPSTGEVWEMAFPPNELVIVPDGTRLVRTAAQASFEQEVRTQQLRFVAQAPGQTSLLLRYVRPQSPAANAPTFRLEVVVEPSR